MILADLLFQVLLVVGTLLGMSLVTIVGLPRLQRARAQFRTRARAIYPYAGMLAVVLVVNSVARDAGMRLSWLIDWNITGLIYAVEGEFVAAIQSYASPALTSYFSFIYVYGYTFLVVFPIVAYFLLDDLQHFRKLMLAYGLNYAIGVACYVLFISYGPRNLMPELVDSLLYVNWPQSKLLTSEVNSNTNVFPSLHTSLSVTAVLLAYRTRRAYPTWTVLSVPLAASVIVATMYLGIHWGVDVVAGGFLAVLSLALTELLTDDQGEQAWLDRTGRRLVALANRQFQRGRQWVTGAESSES